MQKWHASPHSFVVDSPENKSHAETKFIDEAYIYTSAGFRFTARLGTINERQKRQRRSK